MMINHDLYRCLLPEYQNELNKNIKVVKLTKGEILFMEEEVADHIYYVKEGNIKVFKTSEDGQETIFEIYPANSFIALGILFNENRVLPASASSLDNSLIYAIDIKKIEEAIIASPNSSLKWFKYFNSRLRSVQMMLSDQVFADGVQRLKKLVKHFYEKYPSKNDGKYVRVNVPITKQEMADLLNVRRETLSRMLSSLKEEEICECTYKELIVNKEWLFD